MKVSIIGQGYVGSALGHAVSNAGHTVVGVETEKNRLNKISTVFNYQVTDDYGRIKDSEIVVIAVPTPLDKSRNPDLTYLRSACASLKKILTKGVLLVNESTSYPGTLRNVIAPLLGDLHRYASAPERIDPANEKWGIRNTPRLIAGLTDDAKKDAIQFYRSFCDEVIGVSSPEVAEAAKLFENSFRQVNIALVNEFAQIAHALGISSHETLNAAATKPFGFMSFLPSIGVGGHCIPVDPSYLSYAAEKAGVTASIINLANRINAEMPNFVAKRILDLQGSLEGKTIQVAGIAYKPDVSDVRESPALNLIKQLRAMGAKVSWHDELVVEWNGETTTSISKVDFGIIATAHSGLDYSTWKNDKTRVIDVSTTLSLGWPKFL